MHHPPPRQFSGALLGVLAVMSLQGCKRIDMVRDWAPPSHSPTAYLEDSVLTSRVRAALILSPVVNSFNIGVESHKGVVLLSGMAADPTQIDLAVFVAQTVPGVGSVDSFMFSTGLAPTLAVSKGYTPDLGALRAQRLLGIAPRSAPAGLDAPLSALATPMLPGPPLPPASHPPPDQGIWQPPDTLPGPSRWVSLAHSVLGIGSIQDELQIKQ